ncbi:MAG TPA: tRNA (adenosine(37)-N6)-dimethylallyltransferase MiaA [Thermodesulfovibrionales bacterium]|nr:tRNA (adenosine(37)-N6)-dimethylallyltransferase MiaA [Thermodesulfovibrionales bacterium]
MNKVIIILGPTGVGKTGASILLAKSLNTEIISADSMQVYRHMDIGTAKPSPDEMRLVRHHMIDIVEPSEAFSAGSYIEHVIPIIKELHRQRRIPVVVGGTGLYIKAMTRGIFAGPSADWDLRNELLSMEEKNRGSLYRYLRELDPAASSRVMDRDIRRIVRALEVCLKTETGITELQKELTRPLPFEFIRIGLTRKRKELYGLIEERVDSMLSRGLLDEVRRLLQLNPGKTALQAIGYKEFVAYLRGECSMDEAVSLVKKRSRNYAKRQFTWFKREPGIIWCDVTGFTADEDIFRAIAILLENRLT